MENVVAFVLAGLALAGSPGPNTLSLAAAGAAFGARRSLRYMLGLNVGMVCVMAIVATGVMGMVLALPGAAPVIAALAGAYFIYLAWRIATAPPLSTGPTAGREPRFLAGIALSLVNPKAYAAMAALFSSFVLVPQALVADALAKIGLATAMIAGINIAWLLAGAALTRVFREPKANRAVNLVFAALLLSVAAALLL